MIKRFCDNCGGRIEKPIEAHAATVRTTMKGRSYTRHFCEGCMRGAYKWLVVRAGVV